MRNPIIEVLTDPRKSFLANFVIGTLIFTIVSDGVSELFWQWIEGWAKTQPWASESLFQLYVRIALVLLLLAVIYFTKHYRLGDGAHQGMDGGARATSRRENRQCRAAEADLSGANCADELKVDRLASGGGDSPSFAGGRQQQTEILLDCLYKQDLGTCAADGGPPEAVWR